jgi:hypothetical protein
MGFNSVFKGLNLKLLSRNLHFKTLKIEIRKTATSLVLYGC